MTLFSLMDPTLASVDEAAIRTLDVLDVHRMTDDALAMHARR